MSVRSGDSKPQFVALPLSAMTDKELTATDLRMLMVIARHDRMSQHKGTQGAWARMTTMAESIGVTLAAASRSKSRLVERGYVIEDQLGGKGTGRGRRKTLRVVYADRDAGTTCQTDQQIDGRSFDLGGNNPRPLVDFGVSEIPRNPPVSSDQEITQSVRDSGEPETNSGEPGYYIKLLPHTALKRDPSDLLRHAITGLQQRVNVDPDEIEALISHLPRLRCGTKDPQQNALLGEVEELAKAYQKEFARSEAARSHQTQMAENAN